MLATSCPLVRPCLSDRPHGTTRLPLDGLWWHFMFEASSKKNPPRKFNFHYNPPRITRTLYGYVSTFRCILLRMTSISDETCRENQSPNVMFSSLWDNVEKYYSARQATDNIIRQRKDMVCMPNTETRIQNVEYLLLFHRKNGCKTKPQRYVIRTSTVLYIMCALPVFPFTLTLPVLTF